jgi:hypothetical protein
VSDTARSLALEICSGPLDGTGVRVSGGAFTVGSDPSCDVALPEAPGTPQRAAVRYAFGEHGGLTLESECDLDYGGETTRTAAGAGQMLMVRIGSTDLAATVAADEGAEEPPGGRAPDAGGPGGSHEERSTCPHCGWENAPAARWCANCGRDL